jgi:hypothetical protein
MKKKKSRNEGKRTTRSEAAAQILLPLVLTAASAWIPNPKCN